MKTSRPSGPEDSAVKGPSPSILVVCTANVCRSPLAEYALQRALDRFATAWSWQVTSAGADANPGQPMCERAARFVHRYEGGQRFAAGHRSRALDRAMVEGAGLILVASHEQRPAVAALSPEARRRMFNLREATAMLRRLTAVRGPALPVAPAESDGLSALVDLLHDQRGTLKISSGPAHFSSRRSGAVSALDLPDVHEGRGRRHAPTFAAIDQDVLDLARAVPRVCAPLEPQSTARRLIRPR